MKGKIPIDKPFGAHVQYVIHEDTLERQPLPVGGNSQSCLLDDFDGVALVDTTGWHDGLSVEDVLMMAVMKSNDDDMFVDNRGASTSSARGL